MLNDSYVSATEWVSEWLDLQPPVRFGGPKTSISSPEMLLRPTHASPGDWYLFCTHPRQVVFQTLIGLKQCSPYCGHTATAHRMDEDKWKAWVDDVFWVLSEAIYL